MDQWMCRGVMNNAHVAQNAYTDAPDLNPNLIWGSLQVLGWLLFHPAAWRNYVARIDPHLRPAFGLSERTRAQGRDPALRRLLIMGYGIIPGFTGLLCGLMIWGALALAEPASAMTSHTLVSVFYGAGVSVVCAMLIGVTFGMLCAGVGIGVGIASGIANGLTVGIVAGGGFETYPVCLGVLGGVVFSAAGSMISGLVEPTKGRLMTQKIGGSLIGLLAGGAMFGIMFFAVSAGVNIVSGMLYHVAIGLVIGGIVGAAVGGASVRRPRPTGGASVGRPRPTGGASVGRPRPMGGASVGRPRPTGGGWMTGILVGTLIGLASIAMSMVTVGGTTTPTFAERMMFTTLLGTVLCPLFLLPYVWIERVVGPVAGVVTVALSCGGGWALFFAAQSDAPEKLVILSLLGIAAGLTLNLWRPLLGYPLITAWNLLLYHLDERRGSQQPSLLRWHSAFWDEHQWLPLAGLDDHLILVLMRTPAEGQAAMAYLAHSRQRWAAQAAQIELDARKLAQCRDVRDIGEIYAAFEVGDLVGPAEALLRTFSQVSQDVAAALSQANLYNGRQTLRRVEADLDGLLQALTRSSEPYAERFRPIAKRWRAIIGEAIAELARLLEQRREIENPYTFGTPITKHQEIFVGRTDVSARIEQLLLARHCPPLLLYGQRRMGKTSLLNNLGRLLPNTIVPFFVDLQGPASLAETYAGFLYHIVCQMTRSATQERALHLPDLSREALAVDPFIRFDAWLNEIEGALGDRTALLALDEFEALESAIDKGRFDEDIVLGMLRHIIQHRPRFKIILAGSHTLEAFQRWASYLINVQVVHIGYLKEAEAHRLIEMPIEGFPLRYEPDAVQRIMTLTRCHPALVQLLCYEIVTLKNEQPLEVRRLARLKDIAAAVPRALVRGSLIFSGIQRSQVPSHTGEAILRFMAQQGEGAVVSRDTMMRQFPDHLAPILDALVQRELLEPADGGYRFQVELIRRWFALH